MSDDKKDKPVNKIIFSTDLYFGMPLYIKNDPDQDEYFLIDIRLSPGVTNKRGEQIPAVKFHLQYMDLTVWVDDFQCSTERDEIKYLNSKDEDEDLD